MKMKTILNQIFVLLQTLGIPLDVAARLQLNLLVRPSESINLYKDVPEVYFPVMW